MENKKTVIFLVLFMALSVVAAFAGTALGSGLANLRNAIVNNKLNDDIDEDYSSLDDGTFVKVGLYSTLKEEAVSDDIDSEFVSSKNGIDFSLASSDSNGRGLYELSSSINSEFPILYFRGDVDNNNVIFANYCWQIVRTTDAGGVKLIYNGKVVKGKCTDKTFSIGQTSFNNGENGELYLGGYMYDDVYEDIEYELGNSYDYVYGNDVIYSRNTYKLVDTYVSKNGYEADQDEINSKYHYTCFSTNNSCSTVYYIRYPDYKNKPLVIELKKGKKIKDLVNSSLNFSKDSLNSNIKTYVDSWFKNNLLDYSKYLEDSIWCNDRSIHTFGVYNNDSNYSLLYYGYSGRKRTNDVDLTCSNVNNSFTVNNSSGNKRLIYPIGLLTADELKLAGLDSKKTKDNYLYTENSWWTMTPERQVSKSINIVTGGYLNNGSDVTDKLAVRPSIVLKKGIEISRGNGTATNPYIISK